MKTLALVLAACVSSAIVAVSDVAAQEKGVFTVTAKVFPKPGKESEVEALLLKMAQAVKTHEPEMIIYRPHRSMKGLTTVFLWYEQYRSDAAFEFHRTAPHLVDYRKQLGTLVEKPAEIEFYRSLAE
jgi:quinol monooxygenase YgiN